MAKPGWGWSAPLVAMTVLSFAAGAQATANETTAEVFVGTAWNLPLPMTLSGPAESARMRARFSTGAFRRPLYYSVRVGRVRERSGAELELIHHKLYLENPTPPIEQLEVSHGFNLLMANAVRPAAGWQLRLGVGLVIAHPEGRIAGQPVRTTGWTRLGAGYQLAGGAFQLALARRSTLTSGRVALTATPEVKVTAAVARLQLAHGTLFLPNVAAHAVAGLGIRRR